MSLLRETGTIIYIERPLQLILDSSDLTTRPLLAKDNNNIFALHQERKHLYEAYCQYRIMNNGSLEAAVEQVATIIKDIWQRIYSPSLRYHP
jgi:shikimate kinase